MALEAGRGRSSVPVVSSLAAVGLGVTVLVASLTFQASLDHLLGTPRLYGATWDVSFTNFGDDAQPPMAARLRPVLARRADVEAFSIGDATGTPTRIRGQRVDLVAFDRVKGNAVPPIIRGRAPRTAHELALGAITMRHLGVDIGDVVAVRTRNEPQRLEVVGITVLPDVSEGAQLGRGGYVSVAGLERLTSDFAGEAGGVFIRLVPGTDREQLRAELERAYCEGLEAQFPYCSITTSVNALAPTDIVNLGRAQNVPLFIAALLALVAVGTLAHVVVSGVNRRRRDLAVFKVLGFTRSQLVWTVAMQATTIATIALAIGIPLGVITGRWLWGQRADALGVLQQATVPWLAVAFAVPIAVLAANAVAALPASVAASVQPAAVLRSE
jgi:ABC-type lipoprotein release transport system permease subunit